MLEIYTDGACTGNGTDWATASWGYVVVENDIIISEDNGFVRGKQSNNTGELTAIAEAILYAIKNDYDEVLIYSDSRYSIDSLTVWNIEKRRKGQKKANYDLIKDILGLMGQIDVSFEWVKGHSENYLNDYADRLSIELL